MAPGRPSSKCGGSQVELDGAVLKYQIFVSSFAIIQEIRFGLLIHILLCLSYTFTSEILHLKTFPPILS